MLGRLSRRRVLHSSAATMFGAGSLAACGGQPAETLPPASKTPVTVEYLTSLNARQNDNYKRLLVEPFEQTHAPHKLNVAVWDKWPDKVVALVTAGTPPDVVWFAYPNMYLGGFIQEITAYLKRDKYSTTPWVKGLFDDKCVWRGKILGLPNQSGGNWPVLAYNSELLRQAGVAEPPAKWDDPKWNSTAFLDALQKVTRRGADGKVTVYGINQVGPGVIGHNWTGMWKSAWITEDLKTVTSDAPAMVEAFEWLISLTTKYRVMATGPMLQEAFGDANVQNAFLNGKLAMYSLSGGNTFALAQAVAQQRLPIAYAPLPAFKAVNAGQAADDNGIPKGAKHPEESWAFIKWSADTPNWAISRGNAPSRPDHFDTWAKEVYPGDLGKQMRLDVYKESLRNIIRHDPITVLPTFDDMDVQIIRPAFDKLWAGTNTVANALKEMKGPMQAMVPKELPA